MRHFLIRGCFLLEVRITTLGASGGIRRRVWQKKLKHPVCPEKWVLPMGGMTSPHDVFQEGNAMGDQACQNFSHLEMGSTGNGMFPLEALHSYLAVWEKILSDDFRATLG